MKLLITFKKLIAITIIFLFLTENMYSQCNPLITTVPAFTCEEVIMAVSGNGRGFLCNIDGYCIDNIDAPFVNPPYPFCTVNSVINSPIWFSFIADDSGLLVIDMIASNCGTTGVQYAIYDQCGNPMETVACQSIPPIPPDQPFNITAALVPGKAYYFVIDGANGGTCSFEFHSSSGIANLPVGDVIDSNLNSLDPVCPGQSITYSFGGYEYASGYIWLFNGQQVGVTDLPAVTFDIPAGTPEGLSTFCVKAHNDCDPGNKEFCWDIPINIVLTANVELFVCPGDSLLFQNNFYLPGQYLLQDLNNADCIGFIDLNVKEYSVPENDTVEISLCNDQSSIVYEGNTYEANNIYENVTFENESRCPYTAHYKLSTIDDASLYISSTLDEIPCSNPTNATLSLEGNITSSNEIVSQIYKWRKTPDVGVLGINKTLETMFPGEYTLEVTTTFKLPETLTDLIPPIVCVKNLKFVIQDTENIFSQATLEIKSQNPQAGTYTLAAYPSIGWAYYIWSVPEGVNYTETINGEIILTFPEAGLYEICVYMVDICSVSEEKCIEINVPTLSNKNNSFSNSISLMQNPVKDHLIFDINSHSAKDLSLIIRNQNGMTTWSEKLQAQGNKLLIDVHTLLPGVYIFQLHGKNGEIKIGKFVKI